MEALPSWAPAVAFTLFPNTASIWGARIVKKEIPTWYESLEKPSWRPPNWVFPPVWGALYSSMGSFPLDYMELAEMTGQIRDLSEEAVEKDWKLFKDYLKKTDN